MKRRLLAFSLVWGLLTLLGGLTPPPPAVDGGAWRLVVLQSDDWGLEGWFPDSTAARDLGSLCGDVPEGLRSYCTSSLETAADVRRVAGLLGSVRDVDGLPAVLQANTVPAALDPGDPDRLREPGDAGSRYARPGLVAAVDDAIRQGVWWPELHGLTHHDAVAWRSALARGDSVARAAQARDTVAHSAWQRHWELGHPERAETTVAAAVAAFQARFGRAPVSVIAPDYRWGAADEDAFARHGLEVIQAKSEQIDRSMRPGSWWGRVRKVLARWNDRRRDRFVYLERPARLEPYGNPDPGAVQGAHAALAEVEAAWGRGEVAVVSLHRVQLVNLDAGIVDAGTAQLRLLLEALRDRGARFVVDAEVAALRRDGISVRRVGDRQVIRNYGFGSRSFGGETVGPGTHFRPAG